MPARPAATADDLAGLVATQQRALWRYLRALGAAPALADDLLQETFVAAWQRGLGDARDAGALLRGIARHLWLRSRRAFARRRETAIADAVDALWAARSQQDGGDAEVDALRACLDGLDGRARQALELLYGDGRQRREVAAALGMKENGVKMLLQRTRQLLRACIERRRT
jgi:RNA polymerase sigma-70 factor (ECF subfamily)